MNKTFAYEKGVLCLTWLANYSRNEYTRNTGHRFWFLKKTFLNLFLEEFVVGSAFKIFGKKWKKYEIEITYEKIEGKKAEEGLG